MIKVIGLSIKSVNNIIYEEYTIFSTNQSSFCASYHFVPTCIVLIELFVLIIAYKNYFYFFKKWNLNLYEYLNEIIKVKKSNNIFIGKFKYYEIINYLKQLKL